MCFELWNGCWLLDLDLDWTGTMIVDMFKDLFVLDLIFMLCFVKGTVLLLAFCNVCIYLYIHVLFFKYLMQIVTDNLSY